MSELQPHEILEEYEVTLNNKADLDQFYKDMEQLTTGLHRVCPNRIVECVDRRSISRTTNYMLNSVEVAKLALDPRVLNIDLAPHLRGLIKKLNWLAPQTSTKWNKSDTTTNDMKPWGLLRVINGTNYGAEGLTAWGSANYPNVTATVNTTSSGRNVDVVIIDEGHPNMLHPEFAKNPDGSGGSRIVRYNWYQHNVELGRGANSTYDYAYQGSGHSTHTSSTVAGNTMGWARDANIYNLDFTTVDQPMDYVRMFHKYKPINPETGRKNPTICNNSWGYYTGGVSASAVTRVNYRGTTYTPVTGTPVPTGISGIYGSNGSPSAELVSFINGGQSIISDAASIQVQALIDNNLPSDPTGLQYFSTAPTVGSNDDGYWRIDLPFIISFLGAGQTSVYVGTNGYLTFGTGSTVYSNLSASNPASPKIMLTADDNSVQRIYYGQEGNNNNRTYRIYIEGSGSWSGTTGSPNQIYEYTFYKNFPTRIDLKVGINSKVQATNSGFTTTQLFNWHFITSQNFPAKVVGVDVDYEDAMAEGIITMGSAGNNGWRHDLVSGPDYNNTVTVGGQEIYYEQGSSPNSAGTDSTRVCIGAIDHGSLEKKASYSDTGPGVDIWGPGSMIMGAFLNASYVTPAVPDPRNSAFYLNKLSGTSMAGPMVCGMSACILEQYPHWTNYELKKYLQTTATIAMADYSPVTSANYRNALWGSQKFYQTYKYERNTTGVLWPNSTRNISLRVTRQPDVNTAYWPQVTASGAIYPRRILGKK